MGGLDPSGQNTVMSTENDDGLGGSGGIFVFDVSTPLMPREMSSSQMSNTSTAITMPRLGKVARYPLHLCNHSHYLCNE
jgi:hypothetical protein